MPSFNIGKKTLIITGVLLMIAIPVTVYLVTQRTQLINRAAVTEEEGGVATVALEPQSGTFSVGEEFEIKIKVDTKGVAAGIIQTHLTYEYEGDEPEIEVIDHDENKVNGVQIEPGEIPELSFLPDNNNVTDNPVPGSNKNQVVINLSGITSDSETPYTSDGGVVFGTIKFKANKPVDSKQLRFDRDLSKITSFDTGQDILLIPTDAEITVVGEDVADAPRISSIYPTRGNIGSTVVIEGQNFGNEQGESFVKFNQTEVSEYKSWTPKSITAIVPQGAGSGKISVTTKGGTALSSETFTIGSSTSTNAPIIESFHPKTGTSGTSVTIIGKKFGTAQESSSVLFGSEEATEITTWSDVLIEANAPLTVTGGKISVVTTEGTARSESCFLVEGENVPEGCEDDSTGITNIAEAISEDEAEISWKTNTKGTSLINYGLTNSYGKETNEEDTDTKVTTHSITLSNLRSCTTYHYQIISKIDGDEELKSSDRKFTTKGCIGSSDVVKEESSKIDPTSGGSVNLTESGESIDLDVSSDFSDSETTFQIKKLDKDKVLNTTSNPEDSEPLGSNIYELDALDDEGNEVENFENPVSITINYDPTQLGNLDEDSLKIHRWNGSSWEALTDCKVNKTAKTVACSTEGFSTYGLFGSQLADTSTTEEDTTTTSASDTDTSDDTSTDSETQTTTSDTTTEETTTTTTTTTTETTTESTGTTEESSPSAEMDESSPSAEDKIQIPVTGAGEYTKLLILIGTVMIVFGVSLPTIFSLLFNSESKKQIEKYEEDILNNKSHES